MDGIFYGLCTEDNFDYIGLQAKYALDIADFMKVHDSLKLEKRMSSFLQDIRADKAFKKFFKMLCKKSGKLPLSVSIDDLVRFVTCDEYNVSSAKMKSLLKKYAIFQARFGSPEGRQNVINSFRSIYMDSTYVLTDDMKQIVTLDDGELNFPGCDAEVVKSYLGKYNLKRNSFDSYTFMKFWESLILDTDLLHECVFVPHRGEGGDSSKENFLWVRNFAGRDSQELPVAKKILVGGNPRNPSSILSIKYDFGDEVYEIDLKGRGLHLVDYERMYTEKDINFRRMLARHVASREIISSWKNYDYIVYVSLDGKEVKTLYYSDELAYKPTGVCISENGFIKNQNGCWSYSTTANSDFISYAVVLDSSVTVAMLPFISSGLIIGNLEDLESTPNFDVKFEDPQLGIGFTPAFRTGLWINSNDIPKYSWNDFLSLDNRATTDSVLYSKTKSYKLALGIDASDPKHIQIVRTGIDSQKLENMKIAYENNKAARERRELAEWQANYIKEKSPIYGVNQIKTFVNKGYQPFIGMTYKLFNEEYVTPDKFCTIQRSDSNGNYIVTEPFREIAKNVYGVRWYWFYNNKLDHWVDDPY